LKKVQADTKLRAEEIYHALKKKAANTKLKVSDLLEDLDENERDIIEEICVEYFTEKKHITKADLVEVKKKKFV